MAADDSVDAIIAATTPLDLSPRATVAAWAEAQANSAGGSLLGRGLRLFEGLGADAPQLRLDVVQFAGRPVDLGHLHERLMSGEVRRRKGVHLTPGDIARQIVGLLDPSWLEGAPQVLDPSVGGGAFLLAAADACVAAGHEPPEVLARLYGIDIDPTAVAVAEAALGLWGIEHGVAPQPLRSIVAGDGLLDDLPAVDVVVGNPPFLNQLRSMSTNAGERREQLRTRWADLVTTYTDEGWLFLAAAVDAVNPGGQVALVQPVSVLAARHGARVRSWIGEHADLTGLWVADGRVFEAAVEVCAPILQRGRGSRQKGVRRWSGRGFEPQPASSTGVGPEGWGRAGAVITGVPDVEFGDDGAGTVRDLARVTAGFRDQFYGFAPHVVDGPAAGQGEGEGFAPLATVGMIDPFQLRWGQASFKFAGSTYQRPLVDLRQLDTQDPGLAQWTQERLRPKVLVATQTRVVEAVADLAGTVVPATPVISLEPHDPKDVWRLLACLMSPPVAAAAVADNFGTAMSVRALKLSASAVGATPLPVNVELWDRGAELARELQDAAGDGRDLGELRGDFGATMAQAHGFGDAHGLVEWWTGLWPKR